MSTSNKPFDYVNSILSSKKDLIRDSDNPELAEKGYNAYLTNKALSFYTDTIMYANDMNQYHHLDNALQYSYLINTIRSMKRKHTWFKKDKSDDECIELIQQFYKVNVNRAKEIAAILSEEQMKLLRKTIIKGGVSK